MRNSNSLGGRPDVLYFTPECLGVADCKYFLDSQDIKLAMDYCEIPSHWMLGRVFRIIENYRAREEFNDKKKCC